MAKTTAEAARTRTIGLSLSGGGFRATLFHLGVVRALYDAGMLRRDSDVEIRRICSVSGGSVLGAHMVLNWEAYTSTSAEEFEKTTSQLIDLTQRDVRNRIIRRLPVIRLAQILLFVPVTLLRLPIRLFPGLLRRIDRIASFPTATQLLQRTYLHFFKSARHFNIGGRHGMLAALDPDVDEALMRPRLHILATNLSKATLCTFSSRGFESVQGHPEWARGRTDIPIARAVAASSAFPAFFPPVRLRRHVVGWRDEDYAHGSQFITDAGVIDNLGTLKFSELQQSDPVDVVIVSDATGSLRWNARRLLRFTLPASIRTIEISMRQMRELQEHYRPPDREQLRQVFLRIDDVVEGPGAMFLECQEALALLRTDFDRFTDLEVYRLIQHGYTVAARQLRAEKLIPARSSLPGPASWGPDWPVAKAKRFVKSEPEEASRLREGQVRSLPRLWDRRDPFTWLYVALFALVVVAWSWGVPLLAQAHARARAVATAQAFLQKPTVILEKQSPLVENVINLPAYPTNENVEFLEDIRAFDLREWEWLGDTPGPDDRSYVTLTRSIRLRKTGEVDAIRFRFKTSGLDIHLKGPNADARVVAGTEDPSDAGDDDAVDEVAQPRKVRDIEIDISTIATGEEFELTIYATYVNAFQSQSQHWAGALITDDSRAPTSLLLLLPANHHLVETKRHDSFSLPDGRAQRTKTTEGRLIFDPGGRWLLWHLPQPIWKHNYQIQWTWESGAQNGSG